MREEEELSDDLRCKRTDGRQWRCPRRVMDGKKLCELHHLQGRHRQYKQKVPASLKLVRKSKKMLNRESVIEPNGGIRARRAGALVKLAKSLKRKRAIGESEAMGEPMRKIKLKRGDFQLELIRMVLKKEVEKRKKQKTNKKKKKKKKKMSDSNDNDDDCEGELMRDLPNGVMAISASAPHFGNAASPCDIKVGAEPAAMTRRHYRSKNIEPLLAGTLQGNVVSLMRGSKRCHWCEGKGFGSLIRSSSCAQHFFCLECLKKRHFHSHEEVKIACPVCRGTCGCKACSVAQCRDVECKDYLREKNKDKILNFHYLICVLLPVLKQINQEHSMEVDIEAKIKGQQPSEVRILTTEFSCDKQCCSNCKRSILDLHRSCQNCSYNLCLSCCRDMLQGSFPGNIRALACKCPNRKKSCIQGLHLPEEHSITKEGQESIHFYSSLCLPSWRYPDANVGVACPPKDFGGCGDGILDLRCVFPLSWTKKLEISAEEIVGSYELPETLDTSSCCLLCLRKDPEANGIEQLQEAATREDSNDNFLYYPSILDISNDNLEHFQKHWSQGHPVIVRNVFQQTSDLSWDPVAMFSTYLKNSNAKSQNDEALKANCWLDWFEAEIGIKQLFVGSLRGHTETNMCHEKLKLKGWLSSHLFQEHFPAHYAEIINALPLPDYMDPKSGLLNIAAKSQEETPEPDLGPCVYISYCSGEKLVQSDSVIKLCFDFCDMVNILAHTTDAPASTRQICNIRKLMKKHKVHDQKESIKVASDQQMAPEVKSSSINGEYTEEVGLQNLVGEEAQTCDKAAEASRLAATRNGSCNLGVRDSDSSCGGESETDSDFESDFETLEPCSVPIFQSKISENQEFHVDKVASNLLRTENLAKSCGAQWDVFRRQDVPKLLEYLSKHSDEFTHAYGFQKHVGHPRLGQNFFLDTTHKRRLKDEFKIEPWSFKQHVGEAVIIPAGCPYQIRKLKSCVNVVLDFVSPENVTESIHLIDELRVFPEQYKAKAEKLEIKKMAVHSIGTAIKEIREFTCAERLPF